MQNVTYTTKTGIKKSQLVSDASLNVFANKIRKSGGKVVSKEEAEGFIIWFEFENYSTRYEYPTLADATKKLNGPVKAVKKNF